MDFRDGLLNVGKRLKANSPEIFTALSVSGVITTSYLVAKGSFSASRVVDEMDLPEDRKERIKEQVRQTWRFYIPATASGVLTIACIIGSSKASSNRTAAAVTAYSLTEKAFSEYREKVVEQVGKNKEQKIRDEVAQDNITRYPTTSREVIIVGGGHVLCCELFTHRYFRSDMETLRKAQNDINGRIVAELYVSLDEFYDLIDLPQTSNSSKMGWDSDKLMELEFSTVLAEGGEPCLAFEYNYLKPLK